MRARGITLMAGASAAILTLGIVSALPASAAELLTTRASRPAT